MKSNLSVFPFVDYIFELCQESHSQTQDHFDFSPMPFSRNCIVFRFTSRSITQCELLLRKYKVCDYGDDDDFACGCAVAPATIW